MNNDSHQHQPPGRRTPPRREGAQISAEISSPEITRPGEHWHINLGEPWEVTFWSREFQCTESELRSAVQSVGNLAGAVRAYFVQGHRQ